MTALYRYIGKGDAFVHVPPRDLTAEDVAERAELWQEVGITEDLLIKSGLYEKADQPQAEQPKKRQKRGVTLAAEDGE